MELFYVLEHCSHGMVALENEMFGGPSHHRYINATGRWAAHGRREVPLLAWASLENAEWSAAVAAQARNVPIRVTQVGGYGAQLGKNLVLYADHHEPALRGYLPYTNAKLALIETERGKTLRYAEVVIELMTIAQIESEAVAYLNKTAKELHEQYGGGSVLSAAQYLTGKKGLDVVSRILDGELVSEMPTDKLLKAVVLAHGIVTRTDEQANKRREARVRAYEAQRDLAADLLQSVREMQAGTAAAAVGALAPPGEGSVEH